MIFETLFSGVAEMATSATANMVKVAEACNTAKGFFKTAGKFAVDAALTDLREDFSLY